MLNWEHTVGWALLCQRLNVIRVLSDCTAAGVTAVKKKLRPRTHITAKLQRLVSDTAGKLSGTRSRGEQLEENSAVTHCCPCGIWAVTANITSISGQSDWWMGKWWQGKSKRQRRRSRAMPTKWINIKAEMEAHPTSRCVAYFYQIKNWMMKAEIEN